MIDKEEPVALLGDFIKKNRLEKGMTQDDLAYESRVLQLTISRIENGVVNPKWSTTYNLFKVLGVLPIGFEDNDVSLKKV